MSRALTTVLIIMLLPLSMTVAAPSRLPDVVIAFDATCTSAGPFDAAGLRHTVMKTMRQLRLEVRPDVPPVLRGGPTTFSSFSCDLKGDRVDEHFVPRECGATGSCEWGVFSVRPVRFIGLIPGETLLVRRRAGRWSSVTSTSHVSVSDSDVAAYALVRGRYRRQTPIRRYSARVAKDGSLQDDFPRDLLKVRPRCGVWADYIDGATRSN